MPSRSAWPAVSTAFIALTLGACSDDSRAGPAAGSTSGEASGSGGGGGGGGVAAEDPTAWLDRPLREQVEALEAGKITSVGLAGAYLARIEALDTGASGIHAVIALDPEALDRAAALDDARGGGALLQGAPILVKDNIDTQGIATTAGSLALAANVPSADAEVTARLHGAQGLMLGKTNLSEWANFRGYGSSSGWSSLGGQTANGAHPALNPCGSSSGSAAAIAAGMASAALGTETDGSITCPASVNGIVGFKPTVGLVSRAGVIPISDSQDTVGPMTRTVGDAARLLTVLAGPDPADAATDAIPTGLNLDFEAALPAATLQGKRLGVVDFGVGASVQALFDAERARIESAGAVLVDVTIDQTWSADEYTVLLHEFKVGIGAYLAGHPGGPTTLADLIAFNEANADAVMPYFGQEVFLAAQATTGLDDPEYLEAKQRAREAAGVDGIDALLATHDLDALISPTSRAAWPTNHASGDPAGFVASSPAAVAGYPHLSVPMGVVGADGLPVGLSIFAGAWQDAEVLALGYAYESLPR
jgi:amidase